MLPKELRRVFDIESDDSLEIYVEDDRIILKKYHPTCLFCGGADVVEFRGKHICKDCIAQLTEQEQK